MKHRTFAALLAFAACGDPAAAPIDSDSADSTDATSDGTVADDTGEPPDDTHVLADDTGAEPDAPLDSADSTDSALPGDAVASPAEEQPIAIDWAIQSAQGQGVSFGFPTTLALSDGSVVAMSYFNGTIQFGAHTLAVDDDRYTHDAFARVTPDGEVAALTWLCDRCLAQGEAPLLELPDGRIALSSLVDGDVVLAPGTAGELSFTAERELLLMILDRDGNIQRATRIARLPQGGSARALALLPDGGLLVAGDAMGLEIAGIVSFVPEDGWHYPGRAFVIGVDRDGEPRFAEPLDGPAGSTIGLIHADAGGAGFYAVGDFGGYPLGVHTVFGAYTPEEVTLASVSSDDDPAMDIFVSRWTLPAPGAARPTLAWVRRIANYSNGPRPPTWIRATARDGEVDFLIEGADRLEPDDDGELVTPWADDYRHLVVRVTAGGEITSRLASRSAIAPAFDGAFLGSATMWSGGAWSAGDGPTYLVPEQTSGPDGVAWSGHIFEHRDAVGALVASGMLLQRTSASHYPLALHHIAPQRDGSFVLLLHGSAPVTLLPSSGPEVALDRAAGYERLVVLRARFAAPAE